MNRIILLISSFLLLFLNYSNTYSQPASNGFYNTFYRGILNNGHKMTSYTPYNNFNLNLWMHYLDWTDGRWLDPATFEWGWIEPQLNCTHDLLFNTSEYKDEVKNLMIANGQPNNGHDIYRTIGNRVKIDRLCYAQRSDYACSERAKDIGINPYYNFYAFENHDSRDEDYFDAGAGPNGHWVRHVPHLDGSGNSINPHYVVSGLKANREQVNVSPWSSPFEIDYFQTFHIKPKIRIPMGLPDGTQVCRIKVYSWDGTTVIKEVTLKSEYFKTNGSYDGGYKEEFNFGLDPYDLLIPGTQNNVHVFNPLDHGILDDEGHPCLVDYTVEWLGQCDMWIDYIRVDDGIADQMFRTSNNFDPWIQMEVQDIAQASGNNPLKFYIEEFQFKNVPCIKYVNQKIKELSSNQYSLMCDLNISEFYYAHRRDPWSAPWITPEFFKHTLIDAAGLDEVYTFDYPFVGSVPNVPTTDKFGQVYATTSLIPKTLPTSEPNSVTSGIFAQKTDPGSYDTWLQENLDDDHMPNCVNFTATMKLADQTSKITDKPFVHIVQAHLWSTPNPDNSHYLLREPTNEELKMLSYLPLTYGAKGQFYFWWEGWNSFTDTAYGRGLTGTNGSYNINDIRVDNVYNQWSRTSGPDKSSKAETVGKINGKLGDDKWGPYLMNFDNTNRHSYIYRLASERANIVSDNSYFFDAFTYKITNTASGCIEDSPDDTPVGWQQECREKRYLQLASFQKTVDDGNQYFMVVNRRCSPYKDASSEDNNGGRRWIKIRFVANYYKFAPFNTWAIIDLDDDSTVQTFDKRYTTALDLGIFAPGEGKLYQIAPVPVKGGTLVANENISNISFTCEDTVWNNGHSITIGANTNITFTDTSKIIMNGGTFLAGDANVSGSQGISFSSPTNGSHWYGYDFNNCNVQIYNTTFSNVANDTNFAINIVDCPLVDIRGNTFDCGSDNLKGGINAVYYNAFASVQNIYIGGNTFSSSNSSVPALNFMSYAGVTLPLIIENNTFTSGSNSGSMAILLAGVTGGAIKNNTITDFNIGVNLLSSSCDLFNNTISSTLNNSIGVYGTAGSEIKMNPSGGMKLGAANTISNTGTSTNNINVNNSYFYLDNGQNIFNTAEQIPSYHLKGYFPVNLGIPQPWSETYNCFNVTNSPVTPVADVTDGDGGVQLTFGFTPYLTGCEPQNNCGSPTIICLSYGICDTIAAGCIGNGGGESGSYLLPLTKEETERGSMTTITPKNIYDTICVLIRYHNYSSAKTRCFNLIDTYPDSVQAVTAISKLFLALTASDTTSASMTSLKTYYENLILNHAGNVVLINRCNYFVQKCKVRLHQYSSALTGFQQIINQNPYSFEGLLARWDFMATTLLMNGGAGGESSEDVAQRYIFEPQNDWADIDGDKNPFTKEQRGVIKQNINSALVTSKKRDEDKIAELELQSQSGNENAGAVLKQLRKMKEVIKPQTPKNIFEHIKIVRGDIQKLFGGTSSNSKGKGNNLPTVFKLYQNYPNPFNPTATIRYDLPQNVKVNIKIYDLLGRQVKQLVDEFKQAGSYTVNFDGTNLASGVYFYRIEAGKFVDSKKMVLVK